MKSFCLGKVHFMLDDYWALYFDGKGQLTSWGIWVGPFRIIKEK